MPVMDEQTRAGIVHKKYLALLGNSEEQMRNAQNAIELAKLPFRIASQAQFAGETWSFRVWLLEAYPRPVGMQLFEVPLSQLVPVNGGQTTEAPHGIRLVTAGQQWAYSLLGPLQGSVPSSYQGPVVVRVDLQVYEGVVGIAIEDPHDKSKLLEISVGVSAEPETVDIEVPDLASAGQIIIRNYRQLPSTATISSIRVFRGS